MSHSLYDWLRESSPLPSPSSPAHPILSLLVFYYYTFVLALCIGLFFLTDAQLYNTTARDLGFPEASVEPVIPPSSEYLFSFVVLGLVVATPIAAFFAGALLKRVSGWVAILAIMPNLVIWTIFLYENYLDVNYKPLVIVGSICFFLVSAGMGYLAWRSAVWIQLERFGDDTVFGIKIYHLFWLVFVLAFYIERVIFTFTSIGITISWDLKIAHSNRVGYWTVGAIQLAIICLYVYMPFMIYKLLSRKMPELSSFKRTAAILCVLGASYLFEAYLSPLMASIVRRLTSFPM